MRRAISSLMTVVMFGIIEAEAVTWASMQREISVKNGQAMIALGFPFKNTGTTPVRITAVIPSCDCLTPRLEKRIFAPGELGEVLVEFALGGRAGRQEKSVTIISDDAPDSPTVLRLVVDILEPVAISPKFVFWRVGEPAAEKSIEVTLVEPSTDSVGSVQCAESAFVARTESGKDPGQHRVFIRPIDTTKSVQAPIRLTAVVNGHMKVYVIVAAVK